MKYNNLEKLDIILDNEKKILFKNYEQFFLEYNKNINLISKNDEQVIFEKHIFDSLAFNLFLKKYKLNENICVMDIGTGGGFPSFPLALNYSDMKITAVDSIKKKINFINVTAEKLNCKNIITKCTRVEDLSIDLKSTFDVVVTRAMAELRMILEYAIPYIKVGGYFVAYKSIKTDEEVENAKNALKTLNSRVVDKIEYSLPIENENKRVLLVIKKEKEVPSSYPRKNGLVKKKPL